MSKALNYCSIEHGLLDLFIVPDLPLAGCDHAGRTNIVMMGQRIPGLFAVREVSVCPFVVRQPLLLTI